MRNIESSEFERRKVEKFFSLKQPYKIELEKNEGETNLANIAREAEQEYCWAFDEATSTWYYYLSKEHSEEVSRLKGKSTFKTTIPSELLQPPSDSSVFYHIHPDSVVTRLLSKPKKGWHSEEFLRVSNQLPKKDDLEKAAKLKGYKEFRIVTSVGITTYQFHPEKLESEGKKFSTLSIPQKELYQSLDQSFEGAVKKALDYMNEHYQGVFTFHFEKI